MKVMCLNHPEIIPLVPEVWEKLSSTKPIPCARKFRDHWNKKFGVNNSFYLKRNIRNAFCCCFSVTKSCLTLCNPMDSTRRFLCPPLSSGVCSNSCPSSWQCYLTISSSVTLFSFCPHSLSASESFLNIHMTKEIQVQTHKNVTNISFTWKRKQSYFYHYWNIFLDVSFLFCKYGYGVDVGMVREIA